ncbi:MAG: phosphate acyltransferase PlsX [Solirubrobacteraceae bacterium]
MADATVDAGARARRPVVAVDANGADLGAREVAAGAALAAERGARVILFGPAREIGQLGQGEGVDVVDAPLSIAKSADPVRAVRSSPDASIVLAAEAVARGEADALVCAGGTGAALAAGLFKVKRARGIHRPALALPLPSPSGPVTILDVGASVEARREHLVQFAFMGAALAQSVLGVERPRVALLSNGEERERGTTTVLEAHADLAERAGDAPFVFVGNIEGSEVMERAADVVVTDGFTGNVTLKLIEGVSQTVLAAVRQSAEGSLRARLGGALLLPALRSFREQIDPEAQGGAYLLGLRSIGVVPHGRFTRRGFAEAILRASRACEDGLTERTLSALDRAGALRTLPARSETT